MGHNKKTEIHIIGIQKKREKRTVTWRHNDWNNNDPNLGKDMNIQIQEASQTPGRKTQSDLRCDMLSSFRKLKTKRMRTLKAARKKWLVMYKGSPVRIPADSQQKLYRPEGRGMIDLKYQKEKKSTKNSVSSKTVV